MHLLVELRLVVQVVRKVYIVSSGPDWRGGGSVCVIFKHLTNIELCYVKMYVLLTGLLGP